MIPKKDNIKERREDVDLNAAIGSVDKLLFNCIAMAKFHRYKLCILRVSVPSRRDQINLLDAQLQAL